MRAVAARVGRGRDQAVGHRLQARQDAFGDLQFRRIDKVVGRIDPHHRRGDLVQARQRIIGSRGVELLDGVVGVTQGDVLVDAFADFGFDGGSDQAGKRFRWSMMRLITIHAPSH